MHRQPHALHLWRICIGFAGRAELQPRVAVQQQVVLQHAEAHQVSSAGREAADVAVSELNIADLRRRMLHGCLEQSSGARTSTSPGSDVSTGGVMGRVHRRLTTDEGATTSLMRRTWLTCSATWSISSLLPGSPDTCTASYGTHLRAGLHSDSLPLAQSQEQVLRAAASHAALRSMHVIAEPGAASTVTCSVSGKCALGSHDTIWAASRCWKIWKPRFVTCSLADITWVLPQWPVVHAASLPMLTRSDSHKLTHDSRPQTSTHASHWYTVYTHHSCA
jgi:hypothetical protein